MLEQSPVRLRRVYKRASAETPAMRQIYVSHHRHAGLSAALGSLPPEFLVSTRRVKVRVTVTFLPLRLIVISAVPPP